MIASGDMLVTVAKMSPAAEITVAPVSVPLVGGLAIKGKVGTRANDPFTVCIFPDSAGPGGGYRRQRRLLIKDQRHTRVARRVEKSDVCQGKILSCKRR